MAGQLEPPLLTPTHKIDWETAFATDGSPLPWWQQPCFQPVGLQSSEVLEAALHKVTLKGDPTLNVYRYATVRVKRFAVGDLSPLSCYLLNAQLGLHTRLFWKLQTAYQQNLFDLTGIMDYLVDGARYRMAPPVIETYREPTTGEMVSAIVDGLHRVYVAKQLGIKEIWAVEASNVPLGMPLIALPLDWSDLIAYDNMSEVKTKRRYRFGSADEVRAATYLPATADNYQYYLYRDFAALGSGGVRPTPS